MEIQEWTSGTIRCYAQDLSQMVGEDPWLNQLHDVIVGHGVSLLRWRSGGSNTPTIRRLTDSRRHSLKPVAVELERKLGRYIAFASDCAGEVAKNAVAAMQDGDVLLLENTRFHAAETRNDPAFVDALAELGDIYVNDAFSTAHRAHASTEGVAHKLPAYSFRTGWTVTSTG